MSLAARARAWRGQRRRAIVWETLTVAVGGSAAIIAASALADRYWGLPPTARAAALAACGAWLARSLWTRGAAPWRAATWDAVLEAAQDAWPQARPLLASAWALRQSRADAGTSAQLREEHLARADRAADALPARPLFSWTPSRAARVCAGAAAVALAANVLVGDAASWRRALTPWNDPSLERWVDVIPGDARLNAGAPARVEARPNAEGRRRGVRAADLTLESRADDGRWRPLPWTRVDGDAAQWSLAALTQALDYRVRWRGLAGPTRRLTPAPPPRWRALSAVVRAARGARRFDLGAGETVAARRGDWVELEGAADAPLFSAALLVSGAEPTAMTLEAGRWRGGFLARRDAELSFALVAADGRRDAAPPAYAVRVAADAPPTVELISPPAPLVAAPSDALPLSYAARDDGAITRLALIVRAAGRPEFSVALPVPAPPASEVLGDFSWPLSGLPPGTRATFLVRAWDDASPAQTGDSETGSLEIVDADAQHRAALDARAAADEAVERAASLAEYARDSARKGDAASARTYAEHLDPAWQRAARATKQWADRAAEDARGDPGLADEARRAAEQLARAGARGLPAQKEALARGDLKSAADEAAALADEARGVQRALRAGADAQSVQDLAEQSGAAGEDADALDRAAQNAASRGGKMSAEESARVQKALADVRRALDELEKTARELAARSPDAVASDADASALAQARADADALGKALAAGDAQGAARAAHNLAERLRGMARGLREAARAAADARGRNAENGASSVRRAWDEAARAQEAAVEAARTSARARRAGELAAQKALLARVTRAASLARDALAGRTGDPAARAASAEVGEALDRLNGDAASAALLLRDAALRLRAAAPRASGSSAAADAASAADLDAAGQELQRGPAAPAPDPAGTRPAADAQAAARVRAQGLRDEISRASRELGYLSGRVARRVDAALSDEAAGESALRGGDADAGLSRGEAALAALEQGASDAASAQSAAEESAGDSAGAGQGGSVREAGGQSLRRVRLPSARDYRPPRALRDELQRSLGESRPPAADADVKEYLERLAR
ncbi:MAG: hypothetical protein HKL90_12780 [Elusimicrobia bacterium]|nr:hypothetical protein [Elusimicrobiota bacterium]